MILCCENPCAFLFDEQIKMLMFGISAWNVSYSKYGSGRVAFVIDNREKRAGNQVYCYNDNEKLATHLHDNINQNFEIFSEIEEPRLKLIDSAIGFHQVKDEPYILSIGSNFNTIEVAWSEFNVGQQTSIIVENFGPMQSSQFSVQATIIESKTCTLKIDAVPHHYYLRNHYSEFKSSAFLSLAESWLPI